MSERSVEFYSPTSDFAAAGFTIAVIGSTLVSAGLGFLYGAVAAFMPIVYIGIVTALIFGTLVGHLSFLFAKLGHVRNQGAGSAVALVAGLGGIYAAWAADRWLRLSILGVEGINLSLSPADLARYLAFFYEHGFWGLGGGGPLSGPPLAFVWMAELMAVTGLPLMVVRRRLRATPYCEPCRRWPRVEKGVRYVIPNTARALTEQLQKGNVEALSSVAPSAHGAPLALRVDLAQCPGCDGSAYLSLAEVNGSSGWMEFVWARDKVLVRHLRISPSEVEELRTRPTLDKLRGKAKRG